MEPSLSKKAISLITSAMLFSTSFITADENTVVYITDNNATAVWVVDPVTNTVTGQVTVATGLPSFNQPCPVAISPDGSFCYVGDINIFRIDTNTNTATEIVTGAVDYWNGIAISPSQSFAYATAQSTIYIIDTSTNTVTGTIT